MKKLLALILCVMMFVAVIPTSAFAATTWTANSPADGKTATWTTGDYPHIDNPLMSVNTYATEIKNMIGNTKTSIQSAYGVLVGDKVVYTSAKAMDDIIVGLVDNIAKPLIASGDMTTAYANYVKLQVRRLMDLLVTADMAKNAHVYTNADGSIDPIKYAQVFANGVSGALNNKQFQKGYEAVATYFALANLITNVNKELAKEYGAFYDSVDMTFDGNFATYYPALWTFFVDTVSDIAGFTAAGLDPDQWIDDPWAYVQAAGIGNPFVHALESSTAGDATGTAGDTTEDPAEPTPAEPGYLGGETDKQ